MERFLAAFCRLRRSHQFSEFLNFSHSVVKIGRDLQKTMCPYFNRLFHVVPLTPTRYLIVSGYAFLVVVVCIQVHKWRKMRRERSSSLWTRMHLAKSPVLKYLSQDVVDAHQAKIMPIASVLSATAEPDIDVA